MSFETRDIGRALKDFQRASPGNDNVPEKPALEVEECFEHLLTMIYCFKLLREYQPCSNIDVVESR